MYAIAEQVQAWLAEGRQVRVAQVIETAGFSSRDPAAALALTDGEPPAGELITSLPVVIDLPPGIGEITISDAVAATGGLSCGGIATVLVQDAAAYPSTTWDRLIAREPLCLVTRAGVTHLYTPQTIRDAGAFGSAVPRLLGRGTSQTALVDGSAVVALWPVPTLAVVGDGLIAAALVGAAGLLGWHSVVSDSPEAVTGLQPCDAVVVLSHDRAVDGPALAAALAGRAGYVGGLGSRRTQGERAAWLTEHGVGAGDQARIHGPAGLDIDAHSPGEIAISIVAEILASRAGTGGGALRDRQGPVHVGGVQAPPPRY